MTIRIHIGSDVTESSGIRREQGWWHGIFRDSEDDVSGAVDFIGEELVRLDVTAIAQIDRRVIVAQLVKDDIEADGLRALSFQFIDQAGIDLPRPIEAEPETHGPVVYCADAVFIDENKTEICSDGRMQSRSPLNPHVISTALKPVYRLGVEESYEANECDDCQRDEERGALGRLERHARKQTKKPEQHKAALV
jgi:hypothetical protein